MRQIWACKASKYAGACLVHWCDAVRCGHATPSASAARTARDYTGLRDHGRRLLLHIRDIMHTGDDVPCVPADASATAALLEMTRKRLGMTAVVDGEDRLLGLFTDGDLRRTLDNPALDVRTARIADVMTRQPKTIGADQLAVEAARLMETHKISGLIVVDDEQRPVGALNIHDLLRARVV